MSAVSLALPIPRNIAMRRTKSIVLAIVGIVLCSALVVAPDLVPRFIGKLGYVWTPFNSSNFRVGDAYYYAPWVREALSGQWPLQ